MTHGSLFSGIGGFDLAAEWMGWTNVFHCEFAEFPRKILHHYWPEAISYHDIKTTNFTRHLGAVDIITGGFPCQPYSAAGKRKGKDDDRHLWPEMLRAIREVRPRWVVGENVFGIATWNAGLVFEEVCADLEAEGYAVQPFILPAAAVNAPHRRDRVWFVAYSDKCTTGPSRTSRETESDWSKNNDEQSCWKKQTEQRTGCSDVLRVDTDTKSEPSERLQERHAVRKFVESSEVQRNATDSESGSGKGQYEQRQRQGKFRGQNRTIITDTNGKLFQRRGSKNGSKKTKRYAGTSFCGNAWQNFPTQSPICGGDDGLPRELDGITFPKWRNESIKAYGNAIVPQVARQIFQAIQKMEDTTP